VQVPKPTQPLRIVGSLPRRTEGFVVWVKPAQDYWCNGCNAAHC
jgi:hypothetical protein